MDMTLTDILRISAGKYPDKEAIIVEGQRATFLQLYQRVNQRANVLQQRGIKKGDHVATLAKNSLELIECVFAILKVGAVLTPLSYRLSIGELAYILNYLDVKTLIYSTSFENEIHQIGVQTPKVSTFLPIIGPCPPGFIDFEMETRQQPVHHDGPEINDNDVATVLCTAGTTGRPKGVVATHQAWMWSCLNCILALKINRQTISLMVYPMFHVAAFLNLFSLMFSGSTLVLMKDFDPEIVLKLIEQEKINRLGNPPSVYNMILQVPDIGKYNLDSVRLLNSAAEIMPEETRKQIQKAFPNAGIFDNYGMTETCSLVTSRSEEHTESRPNSVGLPVISVELRVEDEQGNVLPPGEIGEIVVRGPNLMTEYYKDKETTRQSLRNGWLYTQDLGYTDKEGFLYIVERKQHMIISGGENIYPKEVEDVLYGHPKILEAAVFGVPDKIWGQNVCAAVVLKPNCEMSAEEVIGYCKDRIASFKKPKKVIFLSKIPRNAVRKVLRTELKKMVVEDVSRS